MYDWPKPTGPVLAGAVWERGQRELLLLVTSLAYYWMVWLAVEVVRQGWQAIIHRRNRCDLSLFQLDLVWLEHYLNEGWPIPVRLQLQASK
jgi:hypothetical protein